MTAQLIDGVALSRQIRADVARRAAQLTAAGHQPGLAVILVGDNPASEVYVRNKVKACAEAGLHSVLEKHPTTLTEDELLARIDALNADGTVHGILVQLPLPGHIDAARVIEAISPLKDVDGFHIGSAGALMVGRIGGAHGGFRPCTPYGCMKMLEAIGCDPRGKHAVVIGRSNIVGKPMAMMLLQASATVTVCHSATPDLAHHTRQADIVVAAVGVRNVLTADMVKPGAVVIDVGMNRNDEGKLCGDVDFDGVRKVAGWITPVPGGVGPMTITMLLVNTLEAAEAAAERTNPLLDSAGLMRFQAIKAHHVEPAIDALLADAKAALERTVAADTPATYEAVSAVLDVATERLGRAWGAVNHLNAVADTAELRAAYNACLPKVTEFHTGLGADERLYAKYKAIARAPDAARLSEPRRQVLQHALRDFVLSGAELQGAAKERYAQIQERMAALSQKYSENVLDATDGYAHYASLDEMRGVPDDVVQAALAAAQADGRDGCKVTLHFPSYFPVMQYATSRELRERLYRAYTTRASEHGPAERDNTGLMQELLALRQEEAELLGHANYAEVSLAPKMAQSPQQVIDFLRDLAGRAKPYGERDMAELREFAQRELGLHDMQAWDQAYVSEKLKEARYAFSEQELKRYFTEDRVLGGLFKIIETVFEVAIRPDTAPVWNEHVRFYRVERNGELMAQFYLDPYARPGKRPGAWMDDARGRWLRPDGRMQTPVAHLVCNFTPPLPGQPALLTHDDVITLFHEFGHGLHHMLTQVADIGVAGISGVEWDAVELPSQFMENFCWEWEVLKHLTAHVETGQALPRALYDKMMAAKNFQSGLQTLRQIEFALFDMRLHAEPGNSGRVQAVLDEVRAEVSVNPPPAFNRFQHAFSHIFAGGYSAGYYSYKWAEVLSADAWSAFEETEPLSVETGRRLRREVFERGGSRPAMENFKAFRGREPSIDALLRHQGMAG